MSAVPTACGAGMWRNRISTGVVMTPAPTPVSPIAAAITNPSKNSMDSSLRLNVDAAFQLVTTPPARPRIVRVRRRLGAGLAPDARVPQVVQGQGGDLVLFQVSP